MAQLWDPFFAETRNFQSLSPGPEEYWRERGSLSRFNLQIKTFPPSYYVRQSDKHELAKILNDPTNEILRYLESQNNTVDSKEAGGTDERTKTVPKRKSQSSGKRKTGVYGNLSSSLTDNNSGNSSPTQSKRAKH